MSKPASRPAVLTTASIVSFSLTLLGAGLAVLAGAVPLSALTLAERVDVGSLLFMAPLLILLLALVFEASRIALRKAPLPEPRLVPVARWTDADTHAPGTPAE